MYDLIIIGMGISGITAAIYAKNAGLNILLLDNDAPGGMLNKIDRIDNYPGLDGVKGPDFAYNLFNKVITENISYKIEEVTDIVFEEVKTIKTKENVYQSKYLIIATGRRPRLLDIKDIDKYLGLGVSTCALCDGALYKNKEVIVVGGGDSALMESLYLANIVNKVHLIHRKDKFRGQSKLIEKIKNKDNIDIIMNSEIKELYLKNDKIEGVVLDNKKIIKGACLFIYIGFIPNTKFLENTDLKLDNGYIVVDEHYKTNKWGVYAVGDVIKKDIYQLINAASEGAEAVINMVKSDN